MISVCSMAAGCGVSPDAQPAKHSPATAHDTEGHHAHRLPTAKLLIAYCRSRTVNPDLHIFLQNQNNLRKNASTLNNMCVGGGGVTRDEAMWWTKNIKLTIF